MTYRRLVPVALVLLAGLALARPAVASEGFHHHAARSWGGIGTSLRPFVGFTSDLGMSPPTAFTPFAGSIFLFGADYAIADHNGFTMIPGLRLGLAPNTYTVTPTLDVAWRFHISQAPALVPYLGVGVGLRMGNQRFGSFFMALNLRFLLGLDVWLPSGFGLGVKLVVPELGPQLTPYVTPVGAVELTFGPRFRF